MRIVQIATLVSPDGAYGGPIRVAVNQTRELLEAGHEVTFAAGAQGFGDSLPTAFDGVPVRLFPARQIARGLGFAGVYAPDLHRWLKAAARTADAVHIHMGRDLVSLPSAVISHRLGVPFFVQTHGMVGPTNHPLSGPVDALWTKRALQSANRVFFLTDTERDQIHTLMKGDVYLQRLHNGVPQQRLIPKAAEESIEVLFLARLHARKRPMMFVEMAERLHHRFREVKFTLVGPDEGEGPGVREAIAAAGLENSLSWEGPLSPEASLERLRRASVYVLPSVDEPFPMSVLEAMSVGLPVVVTDTCGLAGFVDQYGAGRVVRHDIDSLTTAVADLIADQKLRAKAGENALHLTRNTFSMKSVAADLIQAYEGAVDGENRRKF